MKLIAELCQNHNGDFGIVKKMVDAAADAGATHVKIQTIYADNLVFRPQFENGLEINGKIHSIKRPWKTEYDRLKKLELTPEQCADFVNYCKSVGVVPLTTCFTRGDIEEIVSQGFKEIKVASYDCGSYQLIRDLAMNFEHVYVSTGATFDNEIKKTASILNDIGSSFSLLHCVTIYPTPLEEMHLARLNWLKETCFSIGFSDHSLVSQDGVLASKAAIRLGAEVVERHFTILGVDESKDGPVSITPKHLRELVGFAKLTREEQSENLNKEDPNWKRMLGQMKRPLSDSELLNRDYYRGRFATSRVHGDHRASMMIFNWEETSI